MCACWLSWLFCLKVSIPPGCSCLQADGNEELRGSVLRGQIPPHVFVQMTSEELAPKVGLQEGENGCMPLIEVGWVDAANDILAVRGAACG